MQKAGCGGTYSLVIPALGRQRQEDAWGSLADQPSLLGKFQASKKKIWWISKINMADGTCVYKPFHKPPRPQRKHESRAGVSVGGLLLTGNVQMGFPSPDKEGSLLETEARDLCGGISSEETP